MDSKKRFLALALFLAGVAAGVWLAMCRGTGRPVVPVITPAPTNAMACVMATNAVACATNVAVTVKSSREGRRLLTPPARGPSQSKPLRKPITTDPKIPKARQVLLANRRIVVAAGRSFPKRFCATQTPTCRDTAPYVIISELPVSRDVRIQAVANGAKVVGFLPNNALLVEVDAQALKNLEEDVLFLAAVEYEPTDKIQHAILDASGETVEVTIVLLNPKDHDAVQKFVTDNGGTAIPYASSAENSVCATIPREFVEKLAGKAEVKWIERYGRFKVNNDVAVRPMLMNVTPVCEAPLELSGEGQIITTSDTGIDTGDTRSMHADLSEAIAGIKASNWYCSTADSDGHGTHTAGSIVGRGKKSEGKIKGAAPGAKLWAWCMLGSNGRLYTPSSVEELFRPATGGSWLHPSRVDAYIHSASWGDNDNMGAYTAYAGEIDRYIWYHADFLPVFAAGNDGISAGTIYSPATAKNVLSVGATESLRPNKGTYADNAAQIAEFSSCGPCDDGRIKPDIVAPGTYILSCLSSQATERSDWDDGSYKYYQYMGGTSMATPLTAGTAALVREWLVKHRKQANPSAALVKAILTGGATDLKYESGNNALKNVPDTRQGWGRVDLAGCLAPTSGLGVFMVDRLPFGLGSNFTFRVTTTNAAPLNVQLAWVDYPSELSAGKALVNDLDLSVTSADETWFGNGGIEPDKRNNLESVRIPGAHARTYLVRVDCPQIPYDHTNGGAAAIYIRGAFDPACVRRGEPVGTIWTIR